MTEARSFQSLYSRQDKRFYAVARYDEELPQILHNSIRPHTEEGWLSACVLCQEIFDRAGGYISFVVVEIVLPARHEPVKSLDGLPRMRALVGDVDGQGPVT